MAQLPFIALMFAMVFSVFAVVPACGSLEGDIEKAAAANPNAVHEVTQTVATLVESASALLEQAINQAGDNFARVVVQDGNGETAVVNDVAQELKDIKAALDRLKK